MPSQDGDQGHEDLKPYDNLHKSVKTHDDGACLGRHEAYYKADSCSYRWQAVKRVEDEDRHIYDSHPNPKFRVDGTAYRNPSVSTAGKYQAGGALVGVAGPATVAITGKRKGKKYKTVLAIAFRTGFAPYSNQAHHLLPDAELRGAVYDTTESAPQVRDLVFQDLLREKYNLNHWKNMMILPCARTHGQAIGLPTHPNGHNHITYSAAVRIKVKKALIPYQAAVDDEKQGKPHSQPDSKKIKDDVEAVSDGLHTLIVAQRSVVKMASASLEQMDDFHPLVSSSTSF